MQPLVNNTSEKGFWLLVLSFSSPAVMLWGYVVHTIIEEKKIEKYGKTGSHKLIWKKKICDSQTIWCKNLLNSSYIFTNVAQNNRETVSAFVIVPWTFENKLDP